MVILRLPAQWAIFFHAHQPIQACRRQSNHRGSRSYGINVRAVGRFESLLAMKTRENAIRHCWDIRNAEDLDRADERLAGAGFKATISMRLSWRKSRVT